MLSISSLCRIRRQTSLREPPEEIVVKAWVAYYKRMPLFCLVGKADILYEVLLKLGLDLCVPIETRELGGKPVQSIGGGVLLACLAESIAREDVEALAQGMVDWHAELKPAGDTACVFRDSAFADDVAKTNLAAILNQHGIMKVRSL